VIEAMQQLLDDPDEAHRLGANARRYALERFNIARFTRDWEHTIADATMSSLSTNHVVLAEGAKT